MSWPGSSLPGENFCAPATRWVSIIAPTMHLLPPATCAATSRATFHLLVVLLARVRMAEVDHQLARQARGFDLGARRFHARRVVVLLFPPPRRITWQSPLPEVRDDRDLAVSVHRQEVMRPARGLDRVDRDLEVAVGAVLELPSAPTGPTRVRGAPGFRSCARRSRPARSGRRCIAVPSSRPENSLPAGMPRRLMSSSNWRAMRRPSWMR